MMIRLILDIDDHSAHVAMSLQWVSK